MFQREIMEDFYERKKSDSEILPELYSELFELSIDRLRNWLNDKKDEVWQQVAPSWVAEASPMRILKRLSG